MEPEMHYQLIRFIAEGVEPDVKEEWKKKLILRGRRTFEYRNNELYKITPINLPPRIVINKHALTRTLQKTHDNLGHPGIERTYNHISQDFW